MLAIYGRICKLTAGELREIDAGICQLCKDLRIVCNIFMEGIILHQEDIRQSIVVSSFCCSDQTLFNIGIYLFLNIQFEIRMILLIKCFRLLHRIYIKVRIPAPYSQDFFPFCSLSFFCRFLHGFCLFFCSLAFCRCCCLLAAAACQCRYSHCCCQ